MDTTRFDALSRTLAAGSTRRTAMRTLAATGLGFGLARLGFAAMPVGAKKGKGKKKPLGARCSNKDQCGGGLQCKTANSQQSCFPENEKRCCKPIGAKCDDGCECCGIDVICNGGYCQGA